MKSIPTAAEIVDDISSAADEVRRAFDRYRSAVTAAAELEHNALSFQNSPAGIDNMRFDLSNVNTLRPYRGDHALVGAAGAEDPFLEMLLWKESPHWEDRIRAKALYLDLSGEITLPDGFPCIYEPADSPKRQGSNNPRPFVWIASADEDLLRDVLPLYRELWTSYEDQWPTSPNRTFELGRLDGVSPYQVFRPGATVADVIGATLLTHTEMYARAPKHLQEMSFRHRAKATTN